MQRRKGAKRGSLLPLRLCVRKTRVTDFKDTTRSMPVRFVVKIADKLGVAPWCVAGASRVEHATRMRSAATGRRHPVRRCLPI